jgi:membrane protease YdiL (CAAX protease family)
VSPPPVASDGASARADSTLTHPRLLWVVVMAESTDEQADRQSVGAVTDDGQLVTSGAGDRDAGRPWTLLGKLWAVVLAAVLGFGAILLPGLFVLPLVVATTLFSIELSLSPLAELVINFVFGQILAMGGIAGLYLWATGKHHSYIRVRKPTLGELLVITIAPFAVLFLIGGVNIFVSFFFNIEAASHSLLNFEGIEPTFYLLLIPFMILVVGPFEELLYRGVIQTRLTRSFSRPSAIVLASLIFVPIHLTAYSAGGANLMQVLAAFGALFAGSVLYGALYEWTENLTVVAMAHGLTNSIQLLVVYIFTTNEELQELANQATVLVGL